MTPEVDGWSKTSETTAVGRPETPHLYVSRKQYEVASSRVLGSPGRLDTDVVAASPGSTARNSSPLSPRSMFVRAKALFDPRSSVVPNTPEGEKVHGTFCRTKNVVKESLRRRKRCGVAEAGSRDSLRSGFYSASNERLMDQEDEEKSATSLISDEPPQIAPLRPVSKFLPTLTISIPDNKITHSVVAEHYSGEDEGEDDGEDSEHGSLHVAPLRLHSSNLTSGSEHDSTAAETSFYYRPGAKDDNAVFSSSDETSQIDRLVTNFAVTLRDTMKPNRGFKSPTIAPTADLPLVTSSPSPKLRQTALCSTPELQSTSLRSHYTASEPATSPPVLSVPKMWLPNADEHTLRVALSLEDGLHANDLEVYEEDALAAAAPIVRGVVPDVVDIRRSNMTDTSEQQSRAVSNHQRPDDDLDDGQLSPSDKLHMSSSSMANLSTVTSATSTESLAAPPSGAAKRVAAACSSSGASVVVPTMPFQILETIVFSAAYGDAECRALAANLYKEVTETETSDNELRWGTQEQRLLHQSHLMQELDSLVHFGHLRQDIFEMIRGQIFPTGTTELLENRDFTAYIQRAVSSFALGEDTAKEILELAIGIEDESFAQYSPEEEVFFEREPFNPEGFVYDDSTGDDQYERLGSLPSTVGTFESAEPQPQTGWRSSYLLSKVMQVFHLGRWKRAS